jgi:hypothetical protein
LEFGKQAKANLAAANSAANDARLARDEGRTVFIYRIRPAISDSGNLSRPLAAAAETVEAIEREGWSLQNIAYYGDKRESSGVYLFRPATETV